MAAGNGNKPTEAGPRPPCADRGQGLPCVCRAAVTRAYYEMRGSGASPAEAMAVAVRVYNYHHPGLPPRQSARVIEGWIAPGALH